MSVYLWCARVVVVVAVAVRARAAEHEMRGTWWNMVGTWHAISDGLRGVQTNWEARLGGC